MFESRLAERAYFSVADLASRWGVSRRTVTRLVVEGRLRQSRIRGAVRFSAAAVAAYEKTISS